MPRDGGDVGLVVAVGFLGVAAVAAAGWWFFFAPGGGGSRPSTSPPPTSAPMATPTGIAAIEEAAEATPTAVDAGPAHPFWPTADLGDFDPKAFDAVAFLPRAEADARKRWKDATLLWMSVVQAGADGRSDLTVDEYEYRTVSYAFRSPTAADAGARCAHVVWVNQDGAWSTMEAFASVCALPKEAFAIERRCAPRDVFAQLAAKYPPRPGPRVGSVRWMPERSDDGVFHGSWSVDRFPTYGAEDAATDLTTGLLDDCAPHP